MKVNCTTNNKSELPTDLCLRMSYDKFPLICGKEYNVYALTEIDGY